MSDFKTIAILQSNYIPWKGYFDIIAAVDEFVIFDEAQFTRRDWRNRNKIVIDGRPRWLTIPVASKGRFDAPIREIEIADAGWAEAHWRSIRHAYGRAAHFARYGPPLEAAFAQAAGMSRLTDVNEMFLRLIGGELGLATRISRADDIARESTTPTGRLVEICKARGARAYVSGPAARAYIDEAVFAEAGVALHYADYSGYPEYAQATDVFEHGVSAIDLLMRCGPEARGHLKSIRRPRGLLSQSS